MSMISQPKLLRWASNRKVFTSHEVAKHFRVSRQTAAFHLKRLVDRGLLCKQGSTRSASYSLLPVPLVPTVLSLKLIKKIKDLHSEDVVEEVRRRLPLKTCLSQNVQAIFSHALMEILENSILHSQSHNCVVEIRIERGVLKFSVDDRGAGIFSQAQKGLQLPDEFSSAYHLFRQRPSLQERVPWVYFLSRVADQFTLSSHKVVAKVNNEKNDFLILENRFRRGTKVEFSIRARSKKNLQQFLQEFDKERLHLESRKANVRLVGEELLSRAQARRFLAGLESMERITFDFQKVQGIGQAFADEIFRVFQKEHPETLLETVNANLAIQFMIARVL